MRKLLLLFIPFVLMFAFRTGGYRIHDTTVDLYVKDSLIIGDALVDSGTAVILGKTVHGDAAADTIFNRGVVVDSSNHVIVGDLTVSGDVKPGLVYWDMVQDGGNQISGSSGSFGGCYGTLQGATADSIIIDSIMVCIQTSHDDVYIDSIGIFKGVTPSGQESTTELWHDGTNLGVGNVTFYTQVYSVTVTVSAQWRIRFGFWVATSGSAGTGNIYSCKVYGHYK